MTIAAADRSVWLFNSVSKSPCVVADTGVPRHDGHQLRWFAEQLRCCQVHRIMRADGFDGKRPADASEHSVRDSDDVRATFKSSKGTHRRTFFISRQPRAGSST